MTADAGTMKAALYRDGKITVKEVPRPRPGRGEALLRVEAAAVCATDLKIWAGGHRNIPPDSDAVLGHEVVGRITAVGPGVSEGLNGKRVVVAPNVGCGLCPACLAGWDSYCPGYRAYGIGLPGGFAEYMLIASPSIMRGSLIEVPEGLGGKEAVLAEPLSCCYRGLSECGLQAGESALVMGAGPMGIFSIMSARTFGASMVIAADPMQGRRKRSLDFGADRALDPETPDFAGQLLALTGGWGVDVVMVTAPFAGAQRLGISAAAIGGRINLFAGLPAGERFDDFPSNPVHYRGLKVIGTTGTTPAEMRAVVRLMSTGRFEKLPEAVTAVYPLARINEALEEARRGEGIKVVVVPGDHEKF